MTAMCALRDPAPKPVPLACADAMLAARDLVTRLKVALGDERPAGAGGLVAALARSGLATACLPAQQGGMGLANDPERVLVLLAVLRAVGRVELSAGRLLEGHVNAVRLVAEHGSLAQRARMAERVLGGGMLGIWAADLAGDAARQDETHPAVLRGAKAYCSGAGALEAALVIIGHGDAQQLLWLDAPAPARISLATWQPMGMAATDSGTLRLDGIVLDRDDLVGAPGIYAREPWFSAGIWRILAVQVGGIEAMAEGLRQHLRNTGRGQSPVQRARLADAVTAAETARLWVQQAALLAELPGPDAAAAVAHVGLARQAVLRAANEVMEAARHGIGLAALLAQNPLEATARDLTTLLRQPDPDGARDRAAQILLALAQPVGDAWSAGA